MKNLIIRYLNESPTPEEEKKLLLWLKQNAENRKLFLDVYTIWVNSKTAGMNVDKQAALSTFIKRATDYEHHKTKKKKRLQFAASVAAVLLLAVGLSLFVHKQRLHTAYYSQVIQTTQKEKVILPDETVVWLSPFSSLSYPDNFKGDVRKIRFEGDAFFEVSSDAKKPFIIDLGTEEIKVLGTTFNVKNRPADDDKEIVLVTGSIALNFQDTRESYRIEPNEKVTYSTMERTPNVEKVDATLYTIKTQERLIFDNTPLYKVVSFLEIWYGVTIHYPLELGKKTHVSFTIIDESLEQTMKMLSVVAPVRYKIADKEVSLLHDK